MPSNGRKLLSFVVLCLLLLPQAAVFAQDSGTTTSPVFPDVTDKSYNYEAVKYLKDNQVVEGYPDGTYRPNNTLNRAEFLKIVMETAGIEPEGDNCFPDVSDQWYSGYVCKAKAEGFIKGFPDGNFYAGRTIAFTEASKIAYNILNGETADTSGDNWYEFYIQDLETEGAIPPGVDSLVYTLSRGEMAELIWRIQTNRTDREQNTYAGVLAGESIYVKTAEDLTAFTTCTELKDHLVENTQSYDYIYPELLEDEAVSSPSPSAPSDGDSAQTTSANADKGGGMEGAADDYSSTNVQVAGVDEADIVKNDGKYIYSLVGRTVKIIEAYPAESMTELAIIDLDTHEGFSPEDMYLDGDKLVILGRSYTEYEVQAAGVSSSDGSLAAPYIYPYYRYQDLTEVFVYDVSTPATPELAEQFSIEGSLNTSRKVDDTVYVVSNFYSYPYEVIEPLTATAEELLPTIDDSVKALPVNDCNDVYYIPESESTNMLTLTALPLNGGESTSKTIIGDASTVYSSVDNMYIVQNKSDWWWRDSSGFDETIIHKFSINPENIDYIGKASVPGRVLNQFSMDEHKNHFRIATTVGQVWDPERKSQNNIYTLNSKLKQVGQIEGIAPGEEIYSVRFTGDRGYMVTFKKVDPFFVLDLADPANPKILGELKIPGFSDYLHPYDENHIIGFGLDTIEAEEFLTEDRGFDFAWYQGVKIAMFDVTDVTNPKELHRELIGDRGTSTPLSYNHKALLWAPEKGENGKTMFALPIDLHLLSEEEKREPISDFPPYGEYSGQYAYIYDVSPEDGFTLRKTITHQQTDDYVETPGTTYLRDYARNINRILYIGNRLYTVAPEVIGAFTLDSLDEVNELELEPTDNYYYDYWY